MTTKKKPEDKKYVVYTGSIGRTQVGIYYRHVSFDKDKAFVYLDGQNAQADILPRANVYDTHEAAAKYLAGGGKRQ
jgi:hypothetical protein